MDYETKILLNRLVDEVEKLNSPDWWIIGITVVNALIMAWLGWRQYKLQQRQTGALEDDLYRKLAHTIKEIHYEVKNVMYEFYYYLNNQIPILENYDYWSLTIKKFNELRHQLEDYEIDVELKFPKKDFVNIESYKSTVTSTILFCNLCKSLFLENKITKVIPCIEMEKPYEESVRKLSCYVAEDDRLHFYYSLLAFLLAKDSINEEETILKIKKRSKID
jgi:DNA polymerase elongation subunit (family B)